MTLNLGMWPIALLLFAFIIPLIYCLLWIKTELKKDSLLTAKACITVIPYPLVFYLPGFIGYTIAKSIVFIHGDVIGSEGLRINLSFFTW